MTQASPAYTIAPARYAKGQVVVTISNDSGLKNRADCLIGALNGRYVGRSRGYHLSPAKAAKFEALYAAGWDATFMGDLIAPTT